MAFRLSLRLLVLFFTIFAAGNAFGPTILPTGSGRFNSTLHITELVDSSRVDPYNSTHLRRIMISRFDPVQPHDCGSTQLVPYFPPIVAATEDAILAPYDYPTGLWGQLQLQVCSGTGTGTTESDRHEAGEFPLVLFSPGLNTTRLWYSILAQEIASRGYTVVTVDHPYDVDVVQFPDGTVVYGGAVTKPVNGSTASVEQALEVRAADIGFVIDTIGWRGDVLMFGHSFGGAASATAMLHDERIRGGVNLDGAMFGPVLSQGFHHPLKNPPLPQGQSFILWGTQGHNTTSDEGWAQFWATIGAEGTDDVAFKRELSLKDGFHGSFWDLNVLVDVLGIRDGLSDIAQLFVSPVKGERAYEIAGVYLSAFFEQVLTGKEEEILEKDSVWYPEVVILH